METQGNSGWFYIVSVFENHAIVENEDGGNFYHVSYSKENDAVVFGEVTEVHPMFLTSDEKGALEMMRSNFEKMEEEVSELRGFKKDVLKADHENQAEELFTRFNKLDDEDLKDIRENIHELSINDIESKLYEKLGRKTVTFSSQREEKKSLSLKVKLEGENTIKSGYSHILAKHGLKE